MHSYHVPSGCSSQKKGVPSCSKALRSEINSAEAMLTRRSQDRPPRRASRRARARGAYMRCIEVARRWDAGLADQVSDPPHVFGLKCWKEFVSRLFGPQKPLFFVWHQGADPLHPGNTLARPRTWTKSCRRFCNVSRQFGCGSGAGVRWGHVEHALQARKRSQLRSQQIRADVEAYIQDLQVMTVRRVDPSG